MEEDEKGGFLSSIIGERNMEALSSGFKAYGALLTGDLKGFKAHASDYGKVNQEARQEQQQTWSRRREENQAFKEEVWGNLSKGDLSGVVSTYKDRIQEVSGNLKGQGGQQIEEACEQSHPAPCADAPATSAPAPDGPYR